MRRLLALCCLVLLLPSRSRAEDISFDQYGCMITLPDGENWRRNPPQDLPAGQIIFSAARVDQDRQFRLSVLPNASSENIESPSVTGRILEALNAMRVRPGPPQYISWKERRFAEFKATVKTPAGDELFVLTRAALKDNSIYLLMMLGPGNEDNVKEPQFMNVMDSFQFQEAPPAAPPLSADPLFNKYRLAAYACGGAVAGLSLLFLLVYLATQRRGYR